MLHIATVLITSTQLWAVVDNNLNKKNPNKYFVFFFFVVIDLSLFLTVEAMFCLTQILTCWPFPSSKHGNIPAESKQPVSGYFRQKFGSFCWVLPKAFQNSQYLPDLLKKKWQLSSFARPPRSNHRILCQTGCLRSENEKEAKKNIKNISQYT